MWTGFQFQCSGNAGACSLPPDNFQKSTRSLTQLCLASEDAVDLISVRMSPYGGTVVGKPPFNQMDGADGII